MVRSRRQEEESKGTPVVEAVNKNGWKDLEREVVSQENNGFRY